MIKKVIRKILFGYKSSSESFVKHLRDKGCQVGDKVVVFSPNNTVIDESRPFLLKIGNSVRITQGVVILTHDFSYCVCRPIYHDLVNDCSKETIIGDNVFIGMNAVVLPGTRIGNNCIVGAGAIAHGTFPDNVVIAGNPATVICTIDEYYNKRKESRVNDGFALANLIRLKYNREPTIAEMGNYYWLFAPRSEKWLNDNHVNVSMSGDYYNQIITDFINSSPLFDSFDDFLAASKKEKQKETT